MNANEQSKVDYSIEPLEGTPFDIVKSAQGWIVVLGNQALIEFQETREEAINMLEAKKWHIIMVVIATTLKKMGELLNTLKNEKV